jgi:hypothetical protein
LPGGGGLTAPYTRSNCPLWTAGFRVVSAVVGACVLRLVVVFVPRTSSTPVATWFWQTEGRSAERVILRVRPSEFILSEFQSPSRRIFIGSHSLPLSSSPYRSFTIPFNSTSACAQLPAVGDAYLPNTTVTSLRPTSMDGWVEPVDPKAACNPASRDPAVGACSCSHGGSSGSEGKVELQWGKVKL